MRTPQQDRRGRRTAALLVLGAGAALALTACGADAGQAPAAWAQARTQLDQATSVRIEAERRGEAVPGAPAPDATVLAGPVDGSAFEYTGVFRDGEHTVRDESRTVDGRTYSRRTLTERGDVAGVGVPVYEERWTATDGGLTAASAIGGVVDALLASLPAEDALEGAEVDAAPIRREGQDAVRYVLADPVAGADGRMRLQAFTVAEDDGELLTVETVQTTSDGAASTVTFSDWNAVQPPQAPAEEDVTGQG